MDRNHTYPQSITVQLEMESSVDRVDVSTHLEYCRRCTLYSLFLSHKASSCTIAFGIPHGRHRNASSSSSADYDEKVEFAFDGNPRRTIVCPFSAVFIRYLPPPLSTTLLLQSNSARLHRFAHQPVPPDCHTLPYNPWFSRWSPSIVVSLSSSTTSRKFSLSPVARSSNVHCRCPPPRR